MRTSEDLLPGALGPDSARPANGFHPHELIRSERRRAILRQCGDGLALLALDALVLNWHEARLPFATREFSVALLAFANAGLLAWFLTAMKLPQWRARRIASTWCANERKRLQQH